MSKKVNVSLYILMIGFISALSIQKLGVSAYVFRGLDWLSFGTAFGMLAIALAVRKKDFEIYFEWFDWAYYLFLVAVLISAWANPEIDQLYYLQAFLIQYLALNLAVRNLPDYLSPKLFLRSFVISYLPLVASHLVYDPSFLTNSAYAGSFSNPNTFGLFMTPITIATMSLLFFSLSEKKWLSFFLYAFLSLISFYLTIISGSRTAFLAIALALVLASIFYMASLFKKINEKQRTLFFILLFLSVLLAYLILKDSYLALAFKESIIDKFAYQMQKSRLLSGRERIWKYYLKGAYPFKSGVRSVRAEIGLSPHNAFIEVISRFGQVAGFFYISAWLISLVNTVRYSLRNIGKDPYLAFYLMALIAFIGSGLMEVVTYHPVMYLAMFANSIVLFKMRENHASSKSISLAKIKNKMQS